MKTSVSTPGTRETVLSIELEPQEMEAALEEAYQRVARKARIPGFRKGKVPRNILERYLGRDILVEDALQHEIPRVFENALKEQEIQAFAQPRIEVLTSEPLAFKATVPLPPTVDPGNYKSIKVSLEPAEPKDKDIDTAMETLRQQHALLEPKEGASQFGDLLTIDVAATLEGKLTLDEKGVAYQLVEGSPSPVPGFAEQLLDLQKGGEKSFDISLPESYQDRELASKTLSFKVHLLESKTRRLPELNDDFARNVGEDFKDMAALREKVVADLKKEAEQKARAELEEKVIEQALALAKIEFPPIMEEEETERIIQDQARYAGYPPADLDRYLESLGKSKEELMQEWRPAAVKRIQRSLFLVEVAKREGIEIAKEEVDKEIEAVAGASEKPDQVRASFSSAQGRATIQQLLLMRKTRGRLLDLALSPPAEASSLPPEAA